MKRIGAKEGEITLATLVEFLQRNILLFVTFFVVTSIFTAWKFRQNPSYTAVSTILLETSQSNAVQAVAEKLTGGQTYGNVDATALLEKYLMLMGSRGFAESSARILIQNGRAREFLELTGSTEVSPSDEVAIAGVFLGSFDAGRQGNDIIRIAVSQSDSRKAVDLVNVVAATLVDAMTERNARDILQAKKFLTDELLSVERRLREIDGRITEAQFDNKANDYKYGSVTSRTPGDAANMDRENIELNRDLMETESLIASIRASKESGPQGALDKYGAASSLYSLEQKAKYQRLRIEANRKMLDKVLQAMRRSPSNQGEVEGLYKKREVEYILFAELKKEVMSLDIQRISAQNKVRILERSMPGAARAEKNLISTVLKRGLVAVVMAGLLALFMENYDPVVRSPADLSVLRLTYLGSIPTFGRSRRRAAWLHKLSVLIPWRNRRKAHHMHNINVEPDSLQDIVFKNLRVRVNGLLNQGVLKSRVVSVMSSNSGEGKTSLSSNLAKYLAMSGRRVLLIDSDLRMRSLSNSLGFGKDKGVSEHLMNPKVTHEKPLVKKLDTNLEFLPAGQYSVISSELVAGEVFQNLLEAMKHYYDFIILDTPPALPYSEVVPIAAASDLVIFTVLSRSTSIRCVDQTIEKLRFGVSTPIGLVLNQHDDKMFLMYSPYYIDARVGSEQRAA